MRLLLSVALAWVPAVAFSQTTHCRPVGQGAVECTTVPGFQPKSLLEAYEEQGEAIQRRRNAQLEEELLRQRIEERRRQLEELRRLEEEVKRREALR